MPFVAAIIAAAGQGTRLGAAVPKQFLELGGRTVLERSVAALAECPAILEIVVALPHEQAAAPPSYLRDHPRVRVVAGGPRRQDSVANAADAVSAAAEIILIHDAARPFVDRATIERVIEATAASGAAVPALPAGDTVKLAKRSESTWVGGEFGYPLPSVAPASVILVKRTLPRDAVYLAQTPQGFTRAVLARALARGRDGAGGTDEAALAEGAGCPVVLVPGDARNIKITTAADLAFARGLLLERGEVC